MKNPLLTPFDTAPFSKIKNENFSPAIKHFIKVTKSEIDKITTNNQDPTFNNTIVALDITGKELDRVTSIFFNLNSAETNDEIQKIVQEVSAMRKTERGDRSDDKRSETAMEDRKRQGYF